MEFSIETVLTIVTGIAFERGLDNAKQLIEHMTGEPASELTFIARILPEICKEEIIRQYPVLEHFSLMKNINRDNYQDVRDWAANECKSETLFINSIENMPTPEEYLDLI